MARQHTQARFDLLLPSDVLAELREIGGAEETNIAEIIRRVGDLIVTFGIPSPNVPVPPIFAGSTTERFTYYIPNPQLSQLTESALTRGITVHELIRRGLILYCMRKRRSYHVSAASAAGAASGAMRVING